MTFSVWFFGESEHFPNAFSKNDFATLPEAVRYARKTMKEIEGFLWTWHNEGEVSQADKAKFHVGEESLNVEWLWIRDRADTVRIVKDGDAHQVVRAWKARYNDMNEFERFGGARPYE